jgi:hypothetical protein
MILRTQIYTGLRYQYLTVVHYMLELLLHIVRYKKTGTNQILVEMTQVGGETLCSGIHDLICSIMNTKNCLSMEGIYYYYANLQRGC